jgi:hypothetical protein
MVVALVLVLVLSAVLVWPYFVGDLRLNAANFEKIKPGMTLGEVEAILGPRKPGPRPISVDVWGNTTTINKVFGGPLHYVYWWDESGRSIEVIFWYHSKGHMTVAECEGHKECAGI